MRFDVADRGRIDARSGLSKGDDLRLALYARSGITNLCGAIVVYAETADHRVDLVAIGKRLLKALQEHHAASATEDRALRVGIKSPAMAVSRNHSAFLIEIAAFLR